MELFQPTYNWFLLAHSADVGGSVSDDGFSLLARKVHAFNGNSSESGCLQHLLEQLGTRTFSVFQRFRMTSGFFQNLFLLFYFLFKGKY